MNEWMNEWLNKWLNECMNEWMTYWLNSRMILIDLYQSFVYPYLI